MFRIGEFSRFTKVSVKMLRHYDEIDLLKPARVDADSGYRFYAADQLPRLNRIIVLKEAGFSLDQIKHLLTDDLSPEQLRGVMKAKQAEITARLQAEQRRLDRVSGLMASLDESERMPRYHVVLRAIPARRVASIKDTVRPGEVTDLFEEAEAYVARFKARASAPPLMIYHDTEHVDDGETVEVAIPINGDVPPSDRIRVTTIPAVESMACAVYTGAYDRDGRVIGAILAWIEAHGYRVDGPAREVYLRFGADNVGYRLPDAYLAYEADAFVTELQVPVRVDEIG